MVIRLPLLAGGNKKVIPEKVKADLIVVTQIVTSPVIKMALYNRKVYNSDQGMKSLSF